MPEKYWTFCICVVLAASTLAVFGQVCLNEFISFDDDQYISANSYIKAGLTQEGLVWAFTKIYAYNWHPLTWLSHMLDWQLFGENPAGHHLVNLAFHIANTLLLFGVLKRMTHTLWPSAFVAALFALHPLHVESVAWAAERKDVLSAFFWMLTMIAYARYVERPAVGRYLLTALALCLGLMAKQMLVTLPLVLLLLDYWPLRRLTTFASISARRCILEKIPLLILSVIAGVIVYLVQHHVGTVKSFTEYPLPYRIENAVVAYVVYIGKMLWPAKLAIFYPHQYGNLPNWQVGGATLLLAYITITVLRKTQQKPYLAVGWLWYLGTLVPVIGLVQVGLQAYADRYTYIPLIGLFIIVAWGVPDVLARLHHRKTVLSLSAALLLLALGVVSWHQVRHWRNNITLYKHAMAVVKNNWLAHHFLGRAFESQGKFDEAAAQLTESLRINPVNSGAKNDLGKVLLQQGKVDEAVKLYQQFLPILPDHLTAPDAGELAEAVKVYVDAHANLGMAFFRQGRLSEAARHYEEVLRFRPKFVDTYGKLGYAFLQQGNADEAVKVFQKVLQITPDDPNALNALGIALGQQGKLNEAIEYFNEALRIKPDFAEAHNNLKHAQALRNGPDKIK